MAAYLSGRGRYPDVIALPRRTDVSSVEDALVHLDQASAIGLRASLDAESLAQLDMTMSALMAGNDTKIPVAEALLNAQELGGFVRAWNHIVVSARRKALIRKTADAIWSLHAQTAYDALTRGMEDAEIARMQGWAPDHIEHLGTEAGFRRPGETAIQNRARSEGRDYTNWEVGWGVDARCRKDPISAAITEYQRVGWRWADEMFRDPSRQDPREGMAVTFNMMRFISLNHRDRPPRR